MESELLAYCGLYCGACSFKLASETKDLEHLRRMPSRYDAHKLTLPEPCPGCRLENQCGPCAIRDCAISRNLDHCGQCAAFPCERLIQFNQDGAPHHAESIANLQAVKARGSGLWLEDQRQRWTCSCGSRLSWYRKECSEAETLAANPPEYPGRIEAIQGAQALEQAARLAASRHEELRKAIPFLPPRQSSHFLPKIAWMAQEGRLLCLKQDGKMRAFLGGFLLENYRNVGRGAYSPDWCHASNLGPGTFDAYRALYRELAPRWKAEGAHCHAIGVYASEIEVMEALSMTGFGRVMMDAARPVSDLLADLEARPRMPHHVRRAMPSDAPALAELNAALAAHIGASPILMPDPHGLDETRWQAWLEEPHTVAFLSTEGGVATGYMKAQAPEIDVTDAVHGPGTLAINGAFVAPSHRGLGLGRALLLALVRQADHSGKELVSVDCETTNPEAVAFWTRHFRPVAWGFERRT